MYDYKQLAALTAVWEEGGFEKAGLRLHISQSAVTQRIRQLEEEAGRILLVRSQPPRLTDEGRRLAVHFRKVRLLEEELEKGPSGGEGPRICLGVNADSLATWFPEILTAYMARGRGTLALRCADQDLTRALLAEGEVMGCVSASPAPLRGCRSLFLGAMVYRLACTEEFRLRYFPAGLDGPSLLRAPQVHFNRDDGLLSGWGAVHFPGVPLGREGYLVPSSELFPRMIRTGRVCGMIPDRQFRPLPGEPPLVDLSAGRPAEVPLYWHRWRLASEELTLLDRLIEEAASTHLLRP